MIGKAVCLLFIATGVFAQQGFDAARNLYKQAMAQSDLTKRAELLQQSVAASQTYEAYYALGDTEMARNRFGPARAGFDKALTLTADEKAAAAAFYKIGLVCEKSGSALEGIQWLRASLDRSENAGVSRELRNMRLRAADVPQSAEQIQKAFVTGKGFGKTSIDLQVNFAFNQAALAPPGKTQSEGLGMLLADNPYQGYKFVFVGHTDDKGNDAYNDRLSLQRAESVKSYIVERYSVAATRIVIKGVGKRQPLYPAGPENDRLNRRVEVQLVPDT